LSEGPADAGEGLFARYAFRIAITNNNRILPWTTPARPTATGTAIELDVCMAFRIGRKTPVPFALTASTFKFCDIEEFSGFRR
jgi:hypothetical protein